MTCIVRNKLNNKRPVKTVSGLTKPISLSIEPRILRNSRWSSLPAEFEKRKRKTDFRKVGLLVPISTGIYLN